MNESDALLLSDMLDYSREALEAIEGKTQAAVEADVMFARGLIFTVGVIGEAASKISLELQNANSQIPWPQIISMRNRLFHGYNNINYERLWTTINEAIPILIVELEKLASNEK